MTEFDIEADVSEPKWTEKNKNKSKTNKREWQTWKLQTTKKILIHSFADKY